MTPAHGNPSQERSPEASASPPPRPKPAPRVPSGTRGAGEVAAPSGPDPYRRPRNHREPTASRGASPAGEVPGSETGCATQESRREPNFPAHDGAARAEPIVGARVSGRPRRDAGATRRATGRKPWGTPHSHRARGARPNPARGAVFQTGPSRSASFGAARGAIPGTRTEAWTWTVEDGRRPGGAQAPHAEEALSPALTSRWTTSTTGRRLHPRATQRPRHERPLPTIGRPIGGDPNRPRPQRRPERVERGRDDPGAHGARARPKERLGDPRGSKSCSGCGPDRGARKGSDVVPAGRRSRQTGIRVANRHLGETSGVGRPRPGDPGGDGPGERRREPARAPRTDRREARGPRGPSVG